MASSTPYPISYPTGYSLTEQSYIVPGSEKAGQTPIYVNAAFPKCPSIDSDPAYPKTAYQAFELGVANYANSPSLGERPWSVAKGDWADEYTWETYAQTAATRTNVGSGLMKLHADGLVGAPSSTGWSVGIWSHNRARWQHTAQACSAYSLCLVSLYDTLGPNVVEYCMNHAEVRVVFASIAHIPTLLSLAGACTGMKVIVSMDNWVDVEAKGARPGVKSEAVLKAWGAEKGIKVMDMAEIEALGVAFPHVHLPPARKSIASICYTSGTTGNPKGAILTQELLASAVLSNLHGDAMASDSVFFSYLPLSHIYERFCEDVALTAGTAIGYSCGDNLRLLEDLALLKPTYFVSVPRVLNRVYQSIKASTVDAPGFKGTLTRKAFADKLYNLEHHAQIEHSFWDKIVFKKVRAALGGRVQNISTGSAPINPDVLAFLKVAFSCQVSEGYGATENCGTATRCIDGDHAPNGTVGPPQVGVEIRLFDVPDMNYFSTDKPFPRGELCTRGVVIPGYYKDAVKSAEAIDSDGWLHSGDVASVDNKGRFAIIDRIKNLVKLSQGEYVAVEKVENVYALSPLMAQVFVYANSLEDCVVAVIVPDPEKFSLLATKVTGSKVAVTDNAALLAAAANPKVVAAVMMELTGYGERAKLNGFEKIKAIHISLEPFTMENDLLTPTFKTKRNVATKVYQTELDALYASIPKKAAAKL